jgi:hypothetical protein
MTEPTLPREELEALVLEAQELANLPAECCFRCRFGRHDGGGPFYCFRNPPQVIVKHTKVKGEGWQDVVGGQFPPTRPDLWCGEFRTKETLGHRTRSLLRRIFSKDTRHGF